MLTEQDAGLLLQAVELLEEVELRESTLGNDSKAQGASCSAHAVQRLAALMVAMERGQSAQVQQPRLKVRLSAFPESNGKSNWTALLVREEQWGGLVGNCGGISLARGELWNRVAYEAERTRFLIGERDTEPFILDYGDDIKTPEEWKGEVDPVLRRRRIPSPV